MIAPAIADIRGVRDAIERDLKLRFLRKPVEITIHSRLFNLDTEYIHLCL